MKEGQLRQEVNGLFNGTRHSGTEEIMERSESCIASWRLRSSYIMAMTLPERTIYITASSINFINTKPVWQHTD